MSPVIDAYWVVSFSFFFFIIWIFFFLCHLNFFSLAVYMIIWRENNQKHFALFFQWREEPMISFSVNFETTNFNEMFSSLCIPVSDSLARYLV